MEITHLLYADDAIILCDVDVEQMKVFRIIVTIFEGVAGLHDILTGGRVLCLRFMTLNIRRRSGIFAYNLSWHGTWSK